jgi:hypothetical protein
VAALHALHNLPFAKPQEADYIADEAWKQFRAHQHSTDPQEAARLLEEGENRLQIALHYGIAYPRLFHADQFEKVKHAAWHALLRQLSNLAPLACCACTQVPYVQAPRLEEEPMEAVASGIKDRDVAAKLAAAARRRRERAGQQQRLEAQQQQQEGGPG